MTSGSKARLRLWLRLLKLTRQVESQLRDQLRRDFASTLPRFDVMAALSRYPDGLRMSEISGVLRVSNGNVTGIVERLVEDGLVHRAPVPGDRRALRVTLTDRGATEFARQAAAHETWIDSALAAVDPDRAKRLIELIDEMTAEDRDAD